MTASLEILPRSQVDAQDWDATVDVCPTAWLWPRSGYLDAYSSWWNVSDRSFAVCLAGERGPLAVVPLFLEGSRLAKVVPWPRLNSHGGPAFRPDLSHEARVQVTSAVLDEMRAEGRRGRAVATYISSSPLAPAVRAKEEVGALAGLDADKERRVTRVIDMGTGEAQLWAGLEKRARNTIRRAEREGIVVRAAKDETDVAGYYRLHEETYRRTGVRPHPFEYFRRLWLNLLNPGFGFMLLAQKNGKTVAAANFGFYKGAGFFWTGASTDEGLRTGANSLVQWDGLRRLENLGCELYEIGEAFPASQDPKQRSLDAFKRSFGGRLVPTLRWRLLHRPKAEHAARLARALLKRPNPV